MFVDTKENRAIKRWCESNDLPITDRNFHIFKKYLLDNKLLCTFDDVVEDNITYYEIKCPTKFLNKEVIVRDDADYIKIGDLYLNTNRIYNESETILKRLEREQERNNKAIAWIDVIYENNEIALSFYNSYGNAVHDDIIIKDVTEEEAERTIINFQSGMNSSDLYKY